jgi:ABC-type sugar transport system ATPase subunit
MLAVRFEKRVGSFHLRPSFEAEDEMVVLLGPSGSGKSLT